MAISLRTAMPHETKQLTELIEQAGLQADGIQSGIRNYLVVENKEGMLIGTVGLELIEQDGLLRSFVMKKEYSSESLFLRLIQRILLYCKEKGAATLYLLTKADYLFEPLGFIVVPEDEAPAHITETAHYQVTTGEGILLLSCDLAHLSP
ncbi:hypothetical protein A374_18514 [Fictibacillus macauensis ZFHKF-1]|uniref:N-acetyltransferase domain-containing protein n=1 Tax=Fictibacillus macauensis ZFHKF-1 TaxID=1196324 RepID=I8AET2_9BACL|nr:hypothetical protein [Fictibacillus macauensis]EIT83849.1 hypothetical protein A374_18514 [Fictibacillus macauensis ZFHKF-1]